MPGYWIPKNNGYEYVRTSFSNPEKYAEIHEQEHEIDKNNRLKEQEKQEKQEITKNNECKKKENQEQLN
jgi:hypothetical protein